MGHERVGTLPKTQKWRNVVGQIATVGGAGGSDVADIAASTTQNVRSRLRRVHLDPGVKAAFEFLVMAAVASRSADPRRELSELGVDIPDEPNAFSFAKAASLWLARHRGSPEYGRIARGAASDAIAAWYRRNQTGQERLFGSQNDPYEVWRQASNGTGFCELSRLFFAGFTERYLKYFLEREASEVSGGLAERDLFEERLEGHVDEVSQHAFETARIAQSFAAGWFNNNAREHVPDQEAMERFLRRAFGKIRDELSREGLEG